MSTLVDAAGAAEEDVDLRAIMSPSYAKPAPGRLGANRRHASAQTVVRSHGREHEEMEEGERKGVLR